LLIAIPSILTSFLLVLAETQVISVNFLVEYLVALMGLGVAIDDSLLLVTRWREEREAGRSNEDAILAAGPTAGRAVVLSGATVAVGLLSLVLLPVPFLRSIGLGGMLIPLVAIMGHWNWWMPSGLARLLRLPPTSRAEDLAAA
jgi:RND superfamily putative drug exporter